MSYVKDQVAPTPNNSTPIWDLVLKDIAERNADGVKKYGTPLQTFNGRKPLVDLYQELLDAVVYTRQAIEQDKVLFENYRESEKAADDCIEDLLLKLGKLQKAVEPFRKFCQKDMPIYWNTVAVPADLLQTMLKALDSTHDVCNDCKVNYDQCPC